MGARTGQRGAGATRLLPDPAGDAATLLDDAAGRAREAERRDALRLELIDFVDHELIPSEPVFVATVPAAERYAVPAELRAEASRRGLQLGAAQRAELGAELARTWLAAAVCREADPD